ncbi:MAG: hypothetical protein ACHQK9_14370 [Reyranellales bacterium]
MSPQPPVAPGVGTGCRRRGPAASPFGRRPTLSADSDNEIRLYGDLLPDVKFLRRRGFGLHMEGRLYRVGNRLMGAAELKEVAARERRLAGGK